MVVSSRFLKVTKSVFVFRYEMFITWKAFAALFFARGKRGRGCAGMVLQGGLGGGGDHC